MPAAGGASDRNYRYSQGPIKKPPVPPSANTDPTKNMNTYPASILQGAQDYDEIMDRYRQLLSTPDTNNDALARQYQGIASGGLDVNPITSAYQRSPEMAGAASNLSELSRTGGYSDQGLADLRERGISPIRSVYANAQQNLTRNRALQGGYSPNYAAAMAKMTRELSGGIADAVQNTNAGIAQSQASNRVGLAGTYGNFASNETGMMNDVAARNQSAQMAASLANANNRMAAMGGLQNIYGNQQQGKLGVVEGMRTLYGTTPANAALYGNQALQTAQLNQQAKTTPIPVKKRVSGGASGGWG